MGMRQPWLRRCCRAPACCRASRVSSKGPSKGGLLVSALKAPAAGGQSPAPLASAPGRAGGRAGRRAGADIKLAARVDAGMRWQAWHGQPGCPACSRWPGLCKWHLFLAPPAAGGPAAQGHPQALLAAQRREELCIPGALRLLRLLRAARCTCCAAAPAASNAGVPAPCSGTDPPSLQTGPAWWEGQPDLASRNRAAAGPVFTRGHATCFCWRLSCFP